MTDKRIKIYYDDTCNLCSGLVQRVQRSSRGSIFTAVESSHGAPDIGMSAQEAMHEIHVVDERGTKYCGVQAVFTIMKQYPSLRWIAWFGNLPGLRFFAHALYRIVAYTRYWLFGRKNVS